MSGILGYIGARHSLPDQVQAVCQSMGRKLHHQPHVVVECGAPAPRVALGRVSIGLLNPAPQPVRGADGQVWLCLSGEFYHQHARRARLAAAGVLDSQADDAALALQVYLSDGPAGLTGLKGAFVVAVWDNRTDELVIVNDRYGLYPFYYARNGGAFAFAPEIKGVLCAPTVSRRLNQAAIAEYVRFQQLLGDKTWFEDVMLLAPASVLRYRPHDDQLTLTRYWDWDTIGDRPTISFDEATEECIRLFQRAIDEMARPPRRVGVFLSGGLDGRTILGFLDRQAPVTTITFGASGCRDVVYAAELARLAGSRHHWFPFHDGRWVLEYAPLHLALTEGMHGWMHAHGMSTLAQARTLIDVNLSGWGGGTVLGGYAVSYAQDRLLRLTKDEIDLVQRLFAHFCFDVTWPGLTEAEAGLLFCDRRLNGLALESFYEEFARTQHYPYDRRAEYFYLQQHDRRSTHNMVTFARSAIEVACPFFDYDFVEFVYSLPVHIRATPALHRAVITRRLGRLATVPYDKDDRLPHNHPLIYHPHALTQRVKRRLNRHIPALFPDRPRLYADYEHYLRTDLREWAEGILFAPPARERGLFNPRVVRDLWQHHLSGADLWTIGKIAPLITIELVLRLLLDDKPMA